jgi:hypothetical protein
MTSYKKLLAEHKRATAKIEAARTREVRTAIDCYRLEVRDWAA